MSQDPKKLLTEVAFGKKENIVAMFQDMDCSFADAKGQNVLFPEIAKKRGLTAFFLDRGAVINQKNIDGNTPLHIAATNMDVESCKVLLDRGADLSIANKYGNQPLWSALLEAVKVVNLPLGYEMLDALLEHGADKDHKNDAGMSPRFFCELNVTDKRIRQMFLNE